MLTRAIENPILTKFNILVVPVFINTERIFDSKLFTDEIQSKKANDTNLV